MIADERREKCGLWIRDDHNAELMRMLIGDNSAELAEAQKLLDQVVLAFAESEKQASIARAAENFAREQEAPFKVPSKGQQP